MDQRGRLIEIGRNFVVLKNQSGSHRVSINETLLAPTGAQVGDLVSVDSHGLPTLLTPNRSHSTQWMERILDPVRQKGMRTRTQIESGIRDFFTGQGFLEVRTPLLVPCPGMETHIRPMETKQGAFLPTSPEFAMKRLLVGGLEKIFQICPAFRLEPNSTTHHPEFTMLEWYRAYSNYEQIQKDTEDLFEFLAMKIHGKPSFHFQGKEISVKTPWKRHKVRDLFKSMAGVDLVASSTKETLAKECVRLGLIPDAKTCSDTWDDLYFRIWLNLIEPKLPENEAVFVTHYPPSQSALATLEKDKDGTSWARRFEVYAGGLELANAFDELTHPAEQRARFEKDMKLRTEIYGPSFPANPLDEEFLGALSEGMPPSGGIALGVDRLVMLMADITDIESTLWLKSFVINSNSDG